jgi:hypothetical protein
LFSESDKAGWRIDVSCASLLAFRPTSLGASKPHAQIAYFPMEHLREYRGLRSIADANLAAAVCCPHDS